MEISCDGCEEDFIPRLLNDGNSDVDVTSSTLRGAMAGYEITYLSLTLRTNRDVILYKILNAVCCLYVSLLKGLGRD
jgi:hypothetical protein